ncbi:hypothetical protein [Mucilaginibacter sp. PAMB04168]|uniref:hypothetical protein n=1 Tax=Mucilaginibacter sp. PAMB04168 TaxID=3138567 RepID=UPI0031F6C6B2
MFNFLSRPPKPTTIPVVRSDNIIEIELDIAESLGNWHRWAGQLHALYIVIGVIAILSSVFVTTFISTKDNQLFDTKYLPYVSFTSTVSITLITAFNLGPKANNWRKAWRMLHYHYSLYKAGTITMPELLKKRYEADELIGGVDFQYSAK